MKPWRQLSKKDKYRILVIGSGIFIAVYGLVFYPLVNQQLMDSENKISRRMDRMNKRAQFNGDSGGNTTKLNQTLKRLEKSIAATAKKIKERSSEYSNLESATEQQQLRFDITTLARQSGLHIKSMQDIDTSSQNQRGKVVPKVDQVVIDDYYLRPQLKINGTASYWGLLNFLDGLDGLSYETAVGQFSISLQQKDDRLNDEQSNTVQQGLLSLNLTIIL